MIRRIVAAAIVAAVLMLLAAWMLVSPVCAHDDGQWIGQCAN